jgi:type I restriction enzyme M protein
MPPHRPSWFVNGQVVVSSARKCGINKEGLDVVIIDGSEDTEVDDELHADVKAIRAGKSRPTTQVVPLTDVTGPWRVVPTHFDPLPVKEFRSARAKLWPDWSEKSIGELVDLGWVVRRHGHDSPKMDERGGPIPYIKVSDLRAGLVNFNPTNFLSESVAHRLWSGLDSGLQAFDLLSPERASSNIGEFCVLMPGQQRVVLTREIILLRVTPDAPFDAFYLLWALSLKVVRSQWRRIIFMQTNREDIGDREREILLPIPPGKKEAREVSKEFRAYYSGLARLRAHFAEYLFDEQLHHFSLTVAAPD